MRKTVSILAAMMAATLVFMGCQPPASNNANNANKPANAANNASNSNASAATTEEDIKKIMTEIAGELAKNDSDAVAKHYTEDYILITPQGAMQTKAERLADMKSGKSKFESFAYEDIKVRTIGDAAVATATVRAKGTTEGAAVAPNIRATLVFKKTPEGWKVVSGQATAIAATPTTASNTNTASNSNATANSNSNANSSNASK